MKKALLLFYKKNKDPLKYEIEQLLRVISTQSVRVIILSTSFSSSFLKHKTTLREKSIFLCKYSNEENCVKIIRKIESYSPILHIGTFSEDMIKFCNIIKEKLGHVVSDNYSLFWNKKIQRSLLFQDKETRVKSISLSSTDLHFENINKNFKSAFIIKPQHWIESCGVAKIYSKQDFLKYKDVNGHHENYLAEEYIGGDMYSIDYYVDEYGEIYTTPIIQMWLWIDIWIPDFFVYSCVTSTHDIPYWKIMSFLKKSVKLTWVRNTFIHHEFKHTHKKELYTIELNWRIWWRRLKILQNWYSINILDTLFKKNDFFHKEIENYFAVFAIYPPKQWTLLDYNQKLLEVIYSLSSFLEISIHPEKYIGKTIGFTRDGYWNLWFIYLKNASKTVFQKDYQFIKENYKDILLIT